MYFDNQSQDQKLEQNNLKIKKIQSELESLDHKEEELLNSLNISSKQLTTFVNDEKNFNEENWNELSKQKIMFEERLNKEIGNIRNPGKLKKAYSSLNVQRHWLKVR